ncbi:WD domain, G-beta repeat protein [Aphelenchoides fujianensis]|nr:WD domain, G-beta repeat protein [Aphelenchoides fujianensis]
MDYTIVDAQPMFSSPYSNVAQLPYAMAVLLKSDFLIIDLVSNGASYPCFDSPYSMDIHESPVSYMHYISDCPVDLIAALTLVGRNQRRQGVRLSNKPWPITGGVGRECATGHQEIVITGHEDGSVKFWQASGEHLQIIRVVNFAVRELQLCVDSRLLLIAGAHGQVTLFRFVKTESAQDIATVFLPQLCSSSARSNSPPPSAPVESTDKPSARLELHRQRENVTSSYDSQHSTDTSVGSVGDSIPIKVRGGAVRRPAGYQPELVCQVAWINGAVAEKITAIALNSMFGVIAIGTSAGLGLVDMLTSTPIYSWSNSELYNRDSIPFSLPTQHSDALSFGTAAHFDPVGQDVARVRLSGHHAAVRLKLHHSSSNVSINSRLTERSRPTKESTGELNGEQRSPTRPKHLDLQTKTPKLVRRFTHKFARSISSTAHHVEPPACSKPPADDGGAAVGVFAAHSTATPPSTSSSSSKSFMRLNTEFKQRSADRQRPVLSKAQSMAVSSHDPVGEANCNGDFRLEATRSRSPSPSNSAVEKGGVAEFVSSLTFISCCSKKGVPKVEPSLWLGTSTGVVVAFNLFLPTDRIVSNVIVAPSGSLIRLQERIIFSTFMDRSLCLIAAATESYRDPTKEQSAPTSANAEKILVNKTTTKPSQAPTIANGGGERAGERGEIRVISLPGYHQVFHHRPDIPFVKANTTHIRGYPALLCLNAAGHLIVLSLPSLKPLLQSPLFRCSVDIDDPIVSRTDFSEHGLGMYAVTPSELQKFTVCSELSSQVKECAGDLFVPCDNPEPPKTSFLRGVSTLFGGNQKEAADLESVFAEKPTSSTAGSMKSVARQIPNNSLTNMEAAQRGNNLNERSEKLNQVVDATENLRANAQGFQQRSSKLVEKYEKKRWYQL